MKSRREAEISIGIRVLSSAIAACGLTPSALGAVPTGLAIVVMLTQRLRAGLYYVAAPRLGRFLSLAPFLSLALPPMRASGHLHASGRLHAFTRLRAAGCLRALRNSLRPWGSGFLPENGFNFASRKDDAQICLRKQNPGAHAGISEIRSRVTTRASTMERRRGAPVPADPRVASWRRRVSSACRTSDL